MSSARARRIAKPASTEGAGPTPEERERICRAFLAMALSHELKQPLNSLNLNAELLSKRLGKVPGVATAEVGGPLQALGRVVDRITGTLEAFYVRAQPDPVPDDSIDLRPLLAEAVARAGQRAERDGIRLVIEVPDELPPLAVHPHQVAIALDALLDNALDASSRGGEVVLRASADDTDLRMSIVDQGCGMSPEIARRAVEIGFSTKGGGGIGLTVAKFIAYHHSGGFQVESRPAGGTTTTMVLPLSME